MDYIKLSAKNEKELETLLQNSQNIKLRHRDGIWLRKICHARNEEMANAALRTEWNYQTSTKLECSKKRKPKNNLGSEADSLFQEIQMAETLSKE